MEFHPGKRENGGSNSGGAKKKARKKAQKAQKEASTPARSKDAPSLPSCLRLLRFFAAIFLGNPNTLR
jgi:hypothetical protein